MLFKKLAIYTYHGDIILNSTNTLGAASLGSNFTGSYKKKSVVIHFTFLLTYSL